MNIIVCIKQVPDTTDVKINPETNTLIREGVKSIVNPFDMYAIEEGVKIKEKFGGKITALSMGPPQAESALREAISLGVDEGILLSDRSFAGSDTLATSYTLSKAIKKIGQFDLIICGKQAADGDTAQVGPGIATYLTIPQITYVRKIEEIATDKNIIRAERMMEEGFEVIEAPLPCLLTVVKEINMPRLASIKGIMRSKQAKITTWTAKDIEADANELGLNGSPTQVVKIFTPPQRSGGAILKGETKEVADQLVELLRREIS